LKRNQNQNQNQKTSVDKAIERSTFDPIAIVAMAFKLPQDCATEHTFWNGLKERHDFVTEVPSDRWATHELQHNKRSEPGRSITFSAGVLSGLDQFDADFFGISPREAAMVDPQHRLLLELSWEAMENGSYLPSQLAGSNCAVYIGISGLDYGTRMLDDCAILSSHTMTGNTLSIAANRLSYFFDLRGPSLAVDTACSSSLVALHHACRSLHTGEASMALVGGVNMLLHPYPFIGFTKASMLSATGRCRSFDASADGYVRSEGGAVFLLKLLKDALQDGDDVQAVILGTGINADGSRKTGITIPSAEGQADLMRSVIAKAGISPADVDFIEAHGTGTLVGDPIEAHAIGEVYGQDRLTPLPIGSVKANIGHLEPAAGLAGLVKTVLALKNRALPPSLHLTQPNPHINFSQLNLKLITEYTSLSQTNDKPLIAGLNSFGFGGANAHMLVQEFRTTPNAKAKLNRNESEQDLLPPLFLSAKTDDALIALALNYHELLKNKTIHDYYDIAYSAVNYRQRMEKSLAINPTSFESLLNALRLFSAGEFPADVVIENAIKDTGDVAFIYSGNGAQWFGMCQTLMQQSLRFSEILTIIDAIIQPLAGFSVIKELTVDICASRQDDTAVAQPLLFAIQVAITLLLKEQGIEPKAVAGHSVGEVAAAWAAGVFDLKQAAHLICARSQAQALTKGAGRMAAVSLSEQEMIALLAAFDEKLDVEIAGVNSPHNITLSGDIKDLKLIQKRLKSKGIFFKLLDIDYAFHSRQMDTIHDVIQQSLSRLNPSSTKQVTFVSAVTGAAIKGKQLNANYWWQNIRMPVKFADAVDSLIKADCRVFVEIGPHAILQRYLNECIAATEIEARVLPTLMNDKHHGIAQIEQAALRVHIQVGKQQATPYFKRNGQRVRLPNYPWQRERHWNEKTAESSGMIERRREHPILGWRLNKTDTIWENTVDTNVLPWLADHKVGGAMVFPGSAYVELALAAAREWLGEQSFAFEELDIISPIVFDGEHARILRFNLNQRRWHISNLK
jgi:phthiocerol/phenolphthiocerol synthesis type-I polyketide synthase C